MASLVDSRECPESKSAFVNRFYKRRLTWSRIASAGRGIGSPPAGFGAGLHNVPSPITTTTTQRQAPPMESTNADDIREPLPVTQLPGITETLKDLAPRQTNQPPVALPGRPAQVTESVSVFPPAQSGLLNGDRQEKSPKKRKDPAPLLNIYDRRADQIGPSHRIPGVGHLGDLLTPPGWKLGDEPIDEAEAQNLFAASRLKAKKMLDEGMRETGHFSSTDHEELCAEKNAQYQTQRTLDEYLLVERVKLYNFWQERKQKHFHQLHSQPQQHCHSEPKAETRPQPLQPPVQTSMIAYQRHQQSLVPASPHLYAPSPPLSGGTLNARINFMQQGIWLTCSLIMKCWELGADEELLSGLHIPQTPMSPTFLDPGLVPQTLEAVYNCYARNQVIIMNMNNENERFLTQWSARFHVPRPQNPVVPAVIPSLTGQRAAPFGSIHYGYMPQDLRPWTPSQARFEGMTELAVPTLQARPFPSVSNPSNLRQEYGRALSQTANRNGPFRHPDGDTNSPERKIQTINTPESKKVGCSNLVNGVSLG